MADIRGEDYHGYQTARNGWIFQEVALSPHLDQGSLLGPFLRRTQRRNQGWICNDPGLAHFDASVPLVDGLG